MVEPRTPELSANRSALTAALLGVVLFVFLFLLRDRNFLLFHAIAELFSMVVALGIFAIAWNTRAFSTNHFVTWAGYSCLFVGVLDGLHMLSYEGMNIFQIAGTNLGTQFWIAARGIQAVSFAVAAFGIDRRPGPVGVFTAYTVATALLVVAIVHTGWFPVCYDDRLQELTPFKIGAEYAICAVFLTSYFVLRRKRERFDHSVFRYVTATIMTMIAAELAFTLYADPFGVANTFGHLLKLVAFYWLYKGLIEAALARPYTILFRDLNAKQIELARSEERFARFMENLPAAVFIKDAAGRLAYLNQYAARHTAGLHAALAPPIPGGEAVGGAIRRELKRVVGTDRIARNFDVIAFPIKQEGAEPLSGGIAMDVTDRVRAERELTAINASLERRVAERTQMLADINERLTESERRYRVLVEHNPEALVVEFDGRVTFVNPAGLALFGVVSARDLTDRPLATLVAEPERDALAEQWRSVGHSEPTPTREFRVVRVDGQTVEVEGCAMRIPHQGRQAVLVVLRDITARQAFARANRRYQQQLQALAAELTRVEGRERRALAQGLHDDLGQCLAVAKIKLGMARRDAGANAELHRGIDDAVALIDQAIKQTRSLTFELCPPTLTTLGLEPTIDWYLNEYRRSHAIATRFLDDGRAKPLDVETREALYGMFRELLVNVVKHAGAGEVVVSVSREGDLYRLVVADDGVGFAKTDGGGEGVRGFGLFSIRERLGAVGGRLECGASAKGGARIELFVPIAATESPPR